MTTSTMTASVTNRSVMADQEGAGKDSSEPSLMWSPLTHAVRRTGDDMTASVVSDPVSRRARASHH